MTPPSAHLATERPLHVIVPASGWLPVHLREIWEFRELLYFLVWREIRIRYKQTVLGVAWAVLQPLLTMAVFSIIFGRLGRLPSDGVPYPVFVFTSLLPWQFFAFALAESTNSVVTNQRIITKVYFPRLILPMASVCVGSVDFVLGCGVLGVLMAVYGVAPGPAFWTLPLWILLVALTALGVGVWLSALNVRYRDIRYAVPFLLNLWLFATPVAYASSLVPVEWRPVYALNPMVGVIDGFRWALLGAGQPPGIALGVSIIVATVLLIGGLFYFRRMEQSFADLV